MSSNGRTRDFGSLYRGSNPCAPTKYLKPCVLNIWFRFTEDRTARFAYELICASETQRKPYEWKRSAASTHPCAPTTFFFTLLTFHSTLQTTVPLSRGPGRQILILETRVRIPLGLPKLNARRGILFWQTQKY